MMRAGVFPRFAACAVLVVVGAGLTSPRPAWAQYTVQRLLPIEATELRYRVKHTTDGHERVVSEDQLCAQAALPLASVSG